MSNIKSSNQAHLGLIDQVVKHSKQTSILRNDAKQGLVLNAILDTNGSIHLDNNNADNKQSTLNVGSIRANELDKDDFLALLLDPDDISALIESNIEHSTSPNQDPLLYSASNDKTILKIEDVLHEDDSLDKYLPPDKDKWYLYGDGKAIDKAISSPAFRDVHDELLMQQLLTQNYSE